MLGNIVARARHAAASALGVSRLRARIPVPEGDGPVVDFRCNVCGRRNVGIARAAAENRECPSCRYCGSNLRMRSLMYLLSLELHGRPLTLPEFPRQRAILGLGMSDWPEYAWQLAHKMRYRNTFYHASPRLDITDVPAEMFGRHRFLISSDVFEHIPLFALDAAFANARRLLDDNGFLLLTVPFEKGRETVEHYPRLHEFRVDRSAGAPVLRNRTRSGEVESFGNLVFHGGDGATLEMRVFGEEDLLRRLRAAGFRSVEVRADHYPEFGILWPMDWAVPIVAKP